MALTVLDRLTFLVAVVVVAAFGRVPMAQAGDLAPVAKTLVVTCAVLPPAAEDSCLQSVADQFAQSCRAGQATKDQCDKVAAILASAKAESEAKARARAKSVPETGPVERGISSVGFFVWLTRLLSAALESPFALQSNGPDDASLGQKFARASIEDGARKSKDVAFEYESVTSRSGRGGDERVAL